MTAGRRKNWPPTIYHNTRRNIDWIRVRIGGRPKEYTLGPHDSPESRVEFLRIITELEASGFSRPPDAATDMTVAELFAAYRRHAKVKYARSRNFAKQLHRIGRAIGVAMPLYGHTTAKEFGPLALKACRLAMARDRQWSRHYVNHCVGILRAAFRWGVSVELVPETVLRRLETVEDLRRGEHIPVGQNGETVAVQQGKGRVKPPAIGAVEKTLPLLLPPARAMIELMQHTGMRADEVCQVRPCDVNVDGLDPTGKQWPGLWVFVPGHHKTEGQEQEVKVIFLGERCQAVLRPFLERSPAAWCFSPVESVAALRKRQRAARLSPVQPSQQDRRKKSPKRAPGECYDTHGLYNAVKRAARKAGVPHWSPHMLRHGAASVVRRAFTLDHAKAALGQKSLEAALIYAEADLAKAAEVARAMG